ncbi:MAG TPA: 3,4-dihydroxyphenylacetate 2,3-dioxygenase [Trueperaceae bacterium]
MPLTRTNPTPPFRITRTSHAVLGVTDLSRSRDFYVDKLGFILSERTENALYLRGLEERQHHSLVLVEAAEPTCMRLGFKVAGDQELDRAKDWFEARGQPTRWALAHAQGRTLHATGPHGLPLEFCADMTPVARQLQQYARYHGAHIMRIDHLNLFTHDVQSTHDFFAELGFRTTEYTDTSEKGDLWAVWMQRKGNVHDLALTSGRGPRLHHIGLWVPTAMNIIHACDLLATSGHAAALERGPGRHGISNAFFLYLRDPDGHRIELYTSDYLTVDYDFQPIRWALDDPQRQTLWGQPAPRSWFEEGTPFAGAEVRQPLLGAQPVMAH